MKGAEEENEGDKNILLSLMQKPDEEHRSKVKYHSIGFTIFKVSGVNKDMHVDLVKFVI